MLSGQTEEHRIHWLPNEAAATLSQHPQLVQESTESHWVQNTVWLALNRSQSMPTSTPCWWRHPELFGVITTFPLKPSSTQTTFRNSQKGQGQHQYDSAKLLGSQLHPDSHLQVLKKPPQWFWSTYHLCSSSSPTPIPLQLPDGGKSCLLSMFSSCGTTAPIPQPLSV